MWSTWCAVNALAGRATFEEVRFVVVLNGLLVRQSVIVRDKQQLVVVLRCLTHSVYVRELTGING